MGSEVTVTGTKQMCHIPPSHLLTKSKLHCWKLNARLCIWHRSSSLINYMTSFLSFAEENHPVYIKSQGWMSRMADTLKNCVSLFLLLSFKHPAFFVGHHVSKEISNVHDYSA